MFVSSTSCFFLKAASLPKMATRLWYLSEGCNISLTTNCAMVKVSVNVEEDEPLLQTEWI